MSELKRTLIEDVYYPAHDPRKASPEYAVTHKHLVVTLDEPCWICGIRNSDVAKLADPLEQRRRQMETHHSELEWAAEKAFETDPVMLAKLVADMNGQHPQEFLATIVGDITKRVTSSDAAGVREFLDSEGQMLVLCARDHRGSLQGIHSVTYPAWKLQRFQHQGGFQFLKPAA